MFDTRGSLSTRASVVDTERLKTNGTAFKITIETTNNQQTFTARIITKYSLKRFLSIYGEKMSKGLLKFCKLISNLILGDQTIVSTVTNVHKLNSRINYARLH